MNVLKRSGVVSVFIALSVVFACNTTVTTSTQNIPEEDTTALFTPPDTSTIPHNEFGDMVRYGRELIVNTAYYIGPEGTVGKYLGNKMNCGNCHLDGGTRPFGYNYYSTHANYPQYRGRENRILSLGERINNCVERPHNGTPLPLDSKEIIAIECYMKWLGTSVPVGQHVRGDGALELEYPDRPADPNKGALIYAEKCASCHGKDGQGLWNLDSSTYAYPPLWGPYSYQKGSSPHRVLKMARFLKANMPYKIASWKNPTLTDEQAIDVAAFVNDDRIHPRPEKRNSKSSPDYPDISVKPVDYGTGPFIDSFSEEQHKFGPFKPIIEWRKAHNMRIIF